MKPWIIGIVVVVVIGGGGYLLLHNNKKSNDNAQTNTSQASTSSTSSNPSSSARVAATITYDGNNFSPSNTAVKSGDTVEIKNTSSTGVQFQSDPHPTHTDDEDLNVGSVAAGKSATFVVTKTGTFGYHNHLNPSQKGNITIQ